MVLVDLNRIHVVLNMQFSVSWCLPLMPRSFECLGENVCLIIPIFPYIYPARLAMCLPDSEALGVLFCSGGTDPKDGSGANSVCQWEFDTLP